MKKVFSLLIVSCLIFGGVSRLVNLNWGAPFYFHPDERNIASAVTQLQFPHQLNPHFFAYGSLPIYSIYCVGVLKNIFIVSPFTTHVTQVSFTDAIIISRIFSVFFSISSIYLMYILTRKILDQKFAIIASLLTTLNVGFIQYAHFGTFEMWLTFWGMLLVYFSLQILTNKKQLYSIYAGIILGILIAVKISSIVLLIVPLVSIFLLVYQSHYTIVKGFKNMLALIGIASLVTITTSPYIILDSTSFLSSINYESAVAFGELSVFYTQSFFNTIPVVFHLTHIYPFLLSPVVTVFFVISCIFFIYQVIREKKTEYILVSLSFAVLFFSQAFLFVKWTRYMVPTIPFIFLILCISISHFEKSTIPIKKKTKKWMITSILFLLIASSLLHSVLYVHEVLLQKDTRIAASQFARQYIHPESRILSEVYDLGITPFNQFFYSISLFNTYDLDTNHFLNNELAASVLSHDYIILPSQRVLKSRLQQPNQFPKGHAFYQQLLKEEKGFEKIYETTCNLYCRILYNFGFVEETAYVFDRPSVYIFKKSL